MRGADVDDGGDVGAHDVGLDATVRVITPKRDPRRAEAEDDVGRQVVLSRLFERRVAPPRIGRFSILERVGAGGMGVVYAAYDEQLDRKIAIKLMHGADEAGKARLLREAQALARLSHAHVVAVHEVGEFEGRVFIAMEFVRGVTLGRWLRAGERPRGWREVVDVFVQAGRGLEAAHAAGLVHRDFKPENVVIDDDAVVKVVDFGLARTAGEGPEAPSPDPPALDDRPAPAPAPRSTSSMLTSELTVEGAIIGTPGYMALEQLRGQSGTARSDQFSFCVALHEALYGERPFSGDTIAALQESLAAGPPEGPAQRVGPAYLLTAVRRGLDPDPEARWPSMGALLGVLDDRERLGDSDEQRRQLWRVLAAGAAIPLLFTVLLEALPIAEGGVYRPVDLVYVWVMLASVVAVYFGIWRRGAFRAGTNRRVSLVRLTLVAFSGLGRAIGWQLGTPIAVTMLHELLIFAVAGTLGGLLLRWWVGGLVPIALAGAFGIMAYPAFAAPIFSGSTVVMFPVVLVLIRIARKRGRAAAASAAGRTV